MLTDADRDDFRYAIELIQSVVGRHAADITAPALTALQLVISDLDVVRKHMEGPDTQGC